MFRRKRKEKSRKELFDQPMAVAPVVAERSRTDPMTIFTWGAVFVWIGLVFLGANLGSFSALEKVVPGVPGVPAMLHPEVWCVILVGAGLLVWVGTMVRIVVPSFRHDITSGIVLGMILAGVGMGTLYGWDLAWPTVFIGIGIVALLRAFSRH